MGGAATGCHSGSFKPKRCIIKNCASDRTFSPNSSKKISLNPTHHTCLNQSHNTTSAISQKTCALEVPHAYSQKSCTGWNLLSLGHLRVRALVVAQGLHSRFCCIDQKYLQTYTLTVHVKLGTPFDPFELKNSHYACHGPNLKSVILGYFLKCMQWILMLEGSLALVPRNDPNRLSHSLFPHAVRLLND